MSVLFLVLVPAVLLSITSIVLSIIALKKSKKNNYLENDRK